MQASGLVPIVEPEVLLDGDHDIDRTLEVALEVWAQTFKYMADQKVCPPILLPDYFSYKEPLVRCPQECSHMALNDCI